ncbi:MAG: thymidylate kinase, partial [Actinomycetota bacterium]|nr:thymidylate kinase [Actinomycetota bacterium]
GVGKSTTASHLARYLDSLGYDVHGTTQPSRGTLGEIARHHTETYRGLSLACLVAADRYDHLDANLRPNRDAGRIVICDRYVASSYVLQRIDGVPLDFVEALNAAADVPDLAVLLTADPKVAAARVVHRGAHDRFHDGIESTEREIDLYRDTAEQLKGKGWPVVGIDTTNTPPAEVAVYIAAWITRLVDEPDVTLATA